MKPRAHRFQHGDTAERYDADGLKLHETGKIIDLSESGLLYEGRAPLVTGDLYRFRFEVGGRFFFLLGKVARVEAGKAGVRFVVSSEVQEALRGLLPRLRGRKEIL